MEMEQIKQDITTIKHGMAEILSALKGNSISEDGGLIGRVDTLEDDVKSLKDFQKKIAYIVITITGIGVVIRWLIGTNIIHF